MSIPCLPRQVFTSLRKRKLPWLHCFLILVTVMVTACTRAGFTVRNPAEIDARDIRNVAVGTFEVGTIRETVKTERGGQWIVQSIPLSDARKAAVSRAVRARVINLLTSTPYFKVIYTDEFEQLESDVALQQMISVRGYTTVNVDAVISGKLWLDIERTDGVDLTREDLEYFRPPTRYRPGMNLTVEQLIWWPYKSTRGTMGLEIKLTRLNPTEVVAVSFDTRGYAQRIGGKPAVVMQAISRGLSLVRGIGDNTGSVGMEQSGEVLIPFDQMIGEMALSVASAFVKKVAVTEKTVHYNIAQGSHPDAKMLIEAGAFNLAIERLQQSTAEDPDPGDLYNLGLSFEAIGDYGLALTSYREAWRADPENLLYAQGLGRIERWRRESPRLRKQLSAQK